MIAADLRELTDEVREAAFTPVEVKAMKEVARCRIDDKGLAAAAKLAALRRVSNAVKMDLFAWADEHIEPRGDKAA